MPKRKTKIALHYQICITTPPQLRYSVHLGKHRWVPFKPQNDNMSTGRQKPALYQMKSVLCQHETNWTKMVWTKMTHRITT